MPDQPERKDLGTRRSEGSDSAEPKGGSTELDTPFLLHFTIHTERALGMDAEGFDLLMSNAKSRLGRLHSELQQELDWWSEGRGRARTGLEASYEGRERARPRFKVQSVFYDIGSVELFVVLGVVYTAAKDYGTIRENLHRLTNDLRPMIGNVLGIDWEKVPVSGRVAQGGMSSPETERENVETVPASTPHDDAPQTLRQAAPTSQGFSERAGFVLYLAISNIVLILVLGLLLLKTAV
jgi:hypothetical protein